MSRIIQDISKRYEANILFLCITYYFSLRRQYPPLSLQQLQLMIDVNRIDISQPIDLVTLVNSGVYKFSPDQHEFGVHLTDEGADIFKGKVNIEVQWASELVIATIERNGGIITTAYYDQNSLQAMVRTKTFFERGVYSAVLSESFMSC